MNEHEWALRLKAIREARINTSDEHTLEAFSRLPTKVEKTHTAVAEPIGISPRTSEKTKHLLAAYLFLALAIAILLLIILLAFARPPERIIIERQPIIQQMTPVIVHNTTKILNVVALEKKQDCTTIQWTENNIVKRRYECEVRT